MPITLTPNSFRATTIVFDSISKNGKSFDAISNIYDEMFSRTEYLYIPQEKIDYCLDNASVSLYKMLEEEIQEKGTLKNMNLNFSMVYYEDLSDFTKEKFDKLKSFIREVDILLKANNALREVYLCVLKNRSNANEDNMRVLDEIVKEYIDVQLDETPIRVILVDAPPLKSILPYIKATVRVAHVVSRSSQLSNYLRSKSFRTIWTLAMTEYDIEARGDLQSEKKQIERMLEYDGVYNHLQVERNIQEIKEALLSPNDAMVLQDFIDNFPVSKKLKTNFFSFFFKRRDLIRKLNDLAQTLEESYKENYSEARNSQKLLVTNTESVQLFQRLILDVPINHVENILLESLIEVKNKSNKDSRYKINITPCLSIKKLRQKMLEEIENYDEINKDTYNVVFYDHLCKGFSLFLESAEYKKYKTSIIHKLNELTVKVNEGGTCFEPLSYLEKAKDITIESVGISTTAVTSQEMFILTTQKIADEWEKRFGQMERLPKEVMIYNYGILEEQEFQTILLQEISSIEYEKGKKRIFRLE